MQGSINVNVIIIDSRVPNGADTSGVVKKTRPLKCIDQFLATGLRQERRDGRHGRELDQASQWATRRIAHHRTASRVRSVRRNASHPERPRIRHTHMTAPGKKDRMVHRRTVKLDSRRQPSFNDC